MTINEEAARRAARSINNSVDEFGSLISKAAFVIPEVELYRAYLARIRDLSQEVLAMAGDDTRIPGARYEPNIEGMSGLQLIQEVLNLRADIATISAGIVNQAVNRVWCVEYEVWSRRVNRTTSRPHLIFRNEMTGQLHDLDNEEDD